MTRREFLKTDEMTKIRKNIYSCAIAGYIMAVISFILNVVVFGEYFGIADSVLLIILCLIIHLLQSRVAAVILAVYGVANMIYMTIEYGRIAGWGGALIGIYAVVYCFKFHKAWKEEKELEKLRNGGLRDETFE